MSGAGNGQQSTNKGFIRTVAAQVAGKVLGRVAVITMDETGISGRVGAFVRWLIETFGGGPSVN